MRNRDKVKKNYRKVSESCGPSLRELRARGPAPGVTDLGVRYLVGQARVRLEGDQDHDQEENKQPPQVRTGCPNLRVLCLQDVERISLATLSLALLHLTELRVLDHNFLHEALYLMHRTGILEHDFLGEIVFCCCKL